MIMEKKYVVKEQSHWSVNENYSDTCSKKMKIEEEEEEETFLRSCSRSTQSCTVQIV